MSVPQFENCDKLLRLIAPLLACCLVTACNPAAKQANGPASPVVERAAPSDGEPIGAPEVAEQRLGTADDPGPASSSARNTAKSKAHLQQ